MCVCVYACVCRCVCQRSLYPHIPSGLRGEVVETSCPVLWFFQERTATGLITTGSPRPPGLLLGCYPVHRQQLSSLGWAGAEAGAGESACMCVSLSQVTSHCVKGWVLTVLQGAVLSAYQ